MRIGRPRFLPCGRCALGAARLRAARAWFTPPPDSQPAEVLEPAQRRRREKWRRTFPADAEPGVNGLDPMREVVLDRPEDRGDWR